MGFNSANAFPEKHLEGCFHIQNLRLWSELENMTGITIVYLS